MTDREKAVIDGISDMEKNAQKIGLCPIAFQTLREEMKRVIGERDALMSESPTQHVWVLVYYNLWETPNVMLYDNYEAAVKNYRFYKNKYSHIDLGTLPIIHDCSLPNLNETE